MGEKSPKPQQIINSMQPCAAERMEKVPEVQGSSSAARKEDGNAKGGRKGY